MRNVARLLISRPQSPVAAFVLLSFSSLWISGTSELSAQRSSTAPYVQFAPVAASPYYGSDPYYVADPYYAADPYASGPAQPGGWFSGLGIGLPTSDSLRDRVWWRAEYLYWWTRGLDLPPLATTSPAGTPPNEAGVLGEPDTSILFGNQVINDGGTSGLRTSSGLWFSPERRFGITSQFFQLTSQNDGFSASGNGAPIIARPYFDVLNARQAAQLVSYPGLVGGDLWIASKTSLKSYMIAGQGALLPTAPVVCDPGAQPNQLNWIIGYRYLELKDKLSFNENLNSLVLIEPGTLAINEKFSTKNQFSGLQLGFRYQADYRRARLESDLKVAIGNNRQKVEINGNTESTGAGVTGTFNGRLLAQRTNIGSYSRDEFSMVPELGVTLGLRLTNRLYATFGYSVLYFPNVVRAGDQIDTDVNSNLLPPEPVPLDGPLRPDFQFVETDFWAHGLNVGGEFRF